MKNKTFPIYKALETTKHELNLESSYKNKSDPTITKGDE